MKKKLAVFLSLLIVFVTIGSALGTSVPAEAKITAWNCSINDGLYYIQTLGGMAVDIAGGGTANQTNVIVSTPHYGANQLFRFTRQSDNSYIISNDFSGKVLDVHMNWDATTINGSNIEIYDKYGDENQRWFLYQHDDLSYTIGSAYEVGAAPNRQPKWVMDVQDNAISSPGANLWLFNCYGDNNTAQKFWLIPYNDNISINLTSAPSSVKQGDSFSIRGTISSNNPLRKVTGRIFNANGVVVQETTDTFDGSATSAEIRPLNVNQKLLFNKLAVGSYTLNIFVQDTVGCKVYTKSFNVIDSTKPTILNARIENVTWEGYDVICTVTSPNGINRVQFPTWTSANDQDDIQNDWWHKAVASGTRNGDTYTYRVNISDHNGEYGWYNTHIYAFDNNNNYSSVAIDAVYVPAKNTPPVVTDAKITNVTADGYDVSCTVTDDVGVIVVQFPTWTDYNGQDDVIIDWNSNWWDDLRIRGTINGNTATFHVNTSDHNGESGEYITNIYAFDTTGTISAGVEVRCIVPEKDTTPPTVTDAKITNVTTDGYDVSCTVTDNVAVDRVQFPTWTDYNGQDDIKDYTANLNGNTATFHVNISNHNNESGWYITDIYAFDPSGNRSDCIRLACTVPQKIVITSQPSSTTVEKESLASFRVKATGEGLKYLWQYKQKGQTSWTDWTSKTTASISVAYAEYRDGMSLRCVITDSNGSTATSDEAILKYTKPLKITRQPVDVTVDENALAYFNVKASGNGLKYLWQYKEAGKTTWTDWTSKTTASISVAYAAYRNGMSLKCVVTDAEGKKVTSDVATLKYNKSFSITQQPVNTTVNANSLAYFSIKASGNGLKYLWQYKNAGDSSWTDWTNKTTASISVAYAAYRDGMSIRCIVTDASGKKITSNAATLTYIIPLTITKQPVSVSVEKKTLAYFNVKAEGKGLKYLWQYKNAGDTSWTDWTSKTTASISVAYADYRNGMSVRCIVTDASGKKVTSNSATLTYK
ncbi:MAG: GBS Bsp-like repeat-containing protein [Lachnospiraceae bacterium]|nr:GBS Bsp-like repeat-containing protein [Lachnospiraceae bacterium]